MARAQTALAIRTLTGVSGSKAAPAAARVSAAQPGLSPYRQKSLNLPGDNSVYRTVC